MTESPDGAASEITLPLDLTAVQALAAEHGPLRLRIAGLPADVRLSAGDRQADGTWLIGPAGWPGLTLIAPADAPEFDLELLPEPDETPAPEPAGRMAEPARVAGPQDGAAAAPADRPTAIVPTREPVAPPADPAPAVSAAWGTLGAGLSAGAYGLPISRRESWVDAVDDAVD